MWEGWGGLVGGAGRPCGRGRVALWEGRGGLVGGEGWPCWKGGVVLWVGRNAVTIITTVLSSESDIYYSRHHAPPIVCLSVCLSVCVGSTPLDRCSSAAEGDHCPYGAAAAVPDHVQLLRQLPGPPGLEGWQGRLQPHGEPFFKQLVHDTSTGQS